MWSIIIHGFKTMFSNCKATINVWMHRRKKNITEMNYKNWLQLILDNEILCQDCNSITVLIKTRYALHQNRF